MGRMIQGRGIVILATCAAGIPEGCKTQADAVAVRQAPTVQAAGRTPSLEDVRACAQCEEHGIWPALPKNARYTNSPHAFLRFLPDTQEPQKCPEYSCQPQKLRRQTPDILTALPVIIPGLHVIQKFLEGPLRDVQRPGIVDQNDVLAVAASDNRFQFLA